MTLIGLLVAILILAVILYAVSILLSMIDVPQQMKQLVWLAIFVIVLILILSWISGGGLDSIHLTGNQPASR